MILQNNKINLLKRLWFLGRALAAFWFVFLFPPVAAFLTRLLLAHAPEAAMFCCFLIHFRRDLVWDVFSFNEGYTCGGVVVNNAWIAKEKISAKKYWV